MLWFRRLTETNRLLNDVLEAVRPHVNLTFDNILAHINTIYVLKTKSGALAGQGYLRLKVSRISVSMPEQNTTQKHRQTFGSENTQRKTRPLTIPYW